MREDHQLKKYIYAGATALAVVILSLIFFFSIFKMQELGAFASKLLSILMPFIYGFVIAYLLIPVFNGCYKKLFPVVEQHSHSRKKAVRLTKLLSTTVSMLFALAVCAALLWMVLPELFRNAMALGESDFLNSSLRKITVWIEDLLAVNPMLEDTFMQFYNEGVATLTAWVKNDLPQQISSLMNGIWGTVNFFKDLLVGFFIAIYTLNSKELFAAQAKKMVYSLCDVPRANLIVDNMRYVHRVFGRFISGKLLDSLIIGVLCFFGMTILNLPYALLVSVIVGVTNIIPFFGPFIGAIPSAVLIFFVNPMQCLYFILFVLALQQFDGNILGPKILGDSTGLSSFWVMFAILVFGGLFGFFGMVVGVPFFAVIYSLVSGLVNYSLRKRALCDETQAYFDLDHIDTRDHSMCYEKSRVRESVRTHVHEPPQKKNPDEPDQRHPS